MVNKISVEQKEDLIMDEIFSTMKNKGYTKDAAEIICTIANSEQAYSLGYTIYQILEIVLVNVKKYSNEK